MKYLERCVDLPVSKELRDKIKKIKREKTYNDFLADLINKGSEEAKPQRQRSSASS